MSFTTYPRGEDPPFNGLNLQDGTRLRSRKISSHSLIIRATRNGQIKTDTGAKLNNGTSFNRPTKEVTGRD